LLFAEHHDSARGLLPHGTISINDAKAKLWEALGENSFQATGVSTDTGERTIIPDYAWRDLHDIEERGRDVLRVRETSGVWTDRGYNDVALRRQNIMAIWLPDRLEERGRELLALVKPEGPGYMPLYFAAQWIATRGGRVEIDPSDLSVWQDAFAQLLPRIASNEVTVTGMRDGQREKLEGHIFAGILVDFPSKGWLEDNLEEALKDNERYRAALGRIAGWPVGQRSDDAQAMQEAAREALAK
jgi:hypothetical protein